MGRAAPTIVHVTNPGGRPAVNSNQTGLSENATD